MAEELRTSPDFSDCIYYRVDFVGGVGWSLVTTLGVRIAMVKLKDEEGSNKAVESCLNGYPL